MPRVLAHAPLLLGLLLNNQNNNDSAVVKTRTLVVHEQIAEANYLHGVGEFHHFSQLSLVTLLLLENLLPLPSFHYFLLIALST